MGVRGTHKRTIEVQSMKAIKRIIALILVSIFVIGAIFISYTGIKNGAVVYATVNDDAIYVPLRSESDAVKAFQAYCKSRDLTIEGSLSDAVTTFTTGAFNSACNELGIDITELQAEIKAEYDQSGEPVKFFFNDTGVMAMNRIFAQFLQDNELEVGDSADEQNNTVSGGDYFVDMDGNGCYVLEVNTTSGNTGVFASNVVKTGSKYVNSYNEIYNFIGENSNKRLFNTYHINSNDTVNLYGYYGYVSGGWWRIITPNNTNSVVQMTDKKYLQGYLCIEKTADGVYFLALYSPKSTVVVNQIYRLNNVSTQNVIVFLTTNNTVINNNNYEGDTYITNEGDIINNDNPDQADFPDYPNEPTNTPDDWGAEMPDLNIPWYLQGKEEKFPWNIPFNIMLTLSLLKAEPQAPHFEGTMDFKFTTYDYEVDLSQFDDVAEVLRKMEVIAFLIGLMVLTKNLIGW